MAPVKSAQCDIDALATTVARTMATSWCGAGRNIHRRCCRSDGGQHRTERTSAAELAHELNTSRLRRLNPRGLLRAGADRSWRARDDSARGVICGETRASIRAALESITYQIADVVVAMRQHEEFT